MAVDGLWEKKKLMGWVQLSSEGGQQDIGASYAKLEI